jgi:hypothetical protein
MCNDVQTVIAEFESGNPLSRRVEEACRKIGVEAKETIVALIKCHLDILDVNNEDLEKIINETATVLLLETLMSEDEYKQWIEFKVTPTEKEMAE